jgi:hypothetical protein
LGLAFILSPLVRTLNVTLSSELLDFFEGKEPPVIAARAACCHLGPSFSACKVRVPKRPRAALRRANGVNPALARLIVEKNAVAIGPFQQANSAGNLPGKSMVKLLFGDSQEPGNRPGLFGANPHVTGSARAAIAAEGALKS